ncbi:MAG: phosphoglycerate kinase [Candidatus Portnoybacteria bacterium]|nr:phosphoglycerate kinase [Candidatus Portnoybacteria bacterium]
MHKFKLLKDFDVKKKRVLMRVDFNIPLGDDKKISSNERWRIEAVLPTLKYLVEQNSKVILISHLGRPGGKRVDGLSLKPAAEELSVLLNKEVGFLEKTIGDEVNQRIEKMNWGDVLLLENLRFLKEEKENSEDFSKELARFGDVYVNDAFSVSHRKHASVVGVVKFLSGCAGFLFEKEIKEFDKVLGFSEKPFVAVVGGAKISTKIGVINKFLDLADNVLVGGALSNTILAKEGCFMGESLVEECAEKINTNNEKLILPVDFGVWNGKSSTYINIRNVEKGEKALDIGPKSIDLFSGFIKKAKLVVWNGPLGLVEKKPFDKSTTAIAKEISNSQAYSVVGGGDTVAFLRKCGINKFDHISTAGGAMLSYLANETLPGIKALEDF